MDKKPLEEFKKIGLKWFWNYILAYTNEKEKVKKSIGYTDIKYQVYDNVLKPEYAAYNKMIGEGFTPNAIQIDTRGISVIDIDNPDACGILSELKADCGFYVKTRGGYHFYFNKEDVLPSQGKVYIGEEEIADINTQQLFFCEKYYHMDTGAEYNYQIVKSEGLVDMPKYAIEWCERNLKGKGKSSKTSKTREDIVIEIDIIVDYFTIDAFSAVLKCFTEAKYFETYSGWTKAGYMLRHLNNSEEAFKLFDAACRTPVKYKDVPEIDNRRCFYGKGEYNLNFDRNRILYTCMKLDNKNYKYYDSLIVSKYEEETIKLNQKYIYVDDGIKYINEWLTSDDIKIISIKSIYGTGKTHSFKQIVSPSKPSASCPLRPEDIGVADKGGRKPDACRKVLFITYRQSLANSLMDELASMDFKCYLDRCVDIKNSDRAIVQLDSIGKLVDVKEGDYFDDDVMVYPAYDLVVLDETEGLLNHLSFEKINQHTIHNTLINILKNSKKIMCLDGDMGDRAYDFITGLECGYKLYDNVFKGTSKHFVFTKDIDNFDTLIDAAMKAKEPVAVICMTKDESKFLYEKYSAAGYACIIHNSDERNRDVLRNVKYCWGSCDILIYTPVVEAGVDFNTEGYFHHCFALISNNSTSYRAFFQMLNRIRYFKSNIINCFIPRTLEWKVDECLWRFNNMKTSEWKDVELTHLTTILIHNSVEKFNSKNYFITGMVKTLLAKGHTYEYLNDKPKKKSVSRADIKGNNIRDIVEAEMIDKEGFEFYMMKSKAGDLSIEETRSINQYLYRKTFNIDILTEEEMSKIYGCRDIIYNFRNITSYAVKEPIPDTEYLKKFIPLKVDLIRNLIRTLGYTVSASSIDEINGGRKLLNGMRDKLWGVFKEKTFVATFGENRDETIQNLHILLASHLKMYGFELLKHEIKLPANAEGKRCKDYEYSLEYHPIITDYLSRPELTKLTGTFKAINREGAWKASCMIDLDDAPEPTAKVEEPKKKRIIKRKVVKAPEGVKKIDEIFEKVL